MTAEIFTGGAILIFLALLFVVLPMLKFRSERGVGVVLAVVILAFPPAVYFVYKDVSTWLPPDQVQTLTQNTEPASIEEVIAELEARMDDDPTLDGLVALGQTYITMQRFPEAVETWGKAWALNNPQDPQIALGYAEALVLQNREALRGEAAELLEFAIAEMPDDPKALWYSGLSAIATNQRDVAIARLSKLTQNPTLPNDVRQVVQQQLINIGAEPPETVATDQAPGTVIAVNVDFSDELSRPIGAKTVYVIARDADRPRPPMAVKRLSVAEYPFDVELSDNDLMVPGRSLGDVQNLEIIARISMTGEPIATAGDLFGQTIPMAGDEQLNATVLIDSIVE